MIGAMRRGLVRTAAAVLLLTITVGLPAALRHLRRLAAPAHAVPTAADLTGWLTSPLSDTVILNALAVAAWLLWAAFLPAVAAEALAARPRPAHRSDRRAP